MSLSNILRCVLIAVLLLTFPIVQAITTPATTASASVAARAIVQQAPPALIASALVYLGFKAVDYVMDPANNSVKVKIPEDGSFDPNLKYRAVLKTDQTDWHSTPESACRYSEKLLQDYAPDGKFTYNHYSDQKCYYDSIWHTDYNLDVITAPKDNKEDTQVVTAEQLADAIRALAAKGDVTAQEAVDKAGEKTEQKDKTKDKTKDKQKPFDFALPKFCDWATPVCDFVDWMKREPDLTDEKVPQKDIKLKNPSDFDVQYINAGSQCPPDVVKTFNTGFKTEEIRFEMKPICDFAYDYMRPVIIFIAYILAVLTIGNAFKVGG